MTNEVRAMAVAMWVKQAEIANSLTQKIEAATASPSPAFLCLSELQKRAQSAMNSISILVQESKHDHAHDGAVILRALYDIHLQALYMLQDPVPRSAMFRDYLAVQVYDLMRAADKNESDIGEAMRSSLLRPYFVQNVMTSYVAVRAQFLTRKGDACRDNWYPGKLSDIALSVGYFPEYQLMQRRLSNSVHSTPLGLLHGAGVDDIVLMNQAWAFNFRIIGGIARYVGTIQMDEFETLATTACSRSLYDFPSKTA